jgi:acetyl-CoA carboxylase biotin carboxyl carrier protein
MVVEPNPVATGLASAEGAQQPPEEVDPAEGAHIVTSPIVGTFYSSPSPDAEPFARIGDRVSKGQVLCIVEAMKLMNEIESDTAGVIVDIYPKNAQPVEFGEKLFAIKAD